MACASMEKSTVLKLITNSNHQLLNALSVLAHAHSFVPLLLFISVGMQMACFYNILFPVFCTLPALRVHGAFVALFACVYSQR